MIKLCPQERILLRKIFQSRRSRLLYLIYRKRKLKNDIGFKSKLKRAFDYRSDGHLYHDLSLLGSSGLIEEKNGFYLITKKGRAEFQLLETLRLTTALAAGYGAYLLVWTILILSNAQINIQTPLYAVSFILFAIAILCFHTFRTFRPLPPDSSEEFG